MAGVFYNCGSASLLGPPENTCCQSALSARLVTTVFCVSCATVLFEEIGLIKSVVKHHEASQGSELLSPSVSALANASLDENSSLILLMSSRRSGSIKHAV